jgi:SM-20-related protein
VELEAHLAVYPPGSGYGIHVDRFSDDDARVVSVVLYLNDAWRPEDGGCLRLHLGDAGSATSRDIAPRAGTLAVFLADRFPHEVLPARRERYSLTGWFLRRR